MKRMVIILGALVLLVGGIGFAVTSGSNNAEHMAAMSSTKVSNEPIRTDKISIKNYEFGPMKTLIKKGATITWTNQDSAHHNIVFDSGPLKGDEGKLMAQGESYTKTFTEAGIYTYHCGPHPYMKATITVEE